MKFFKMKLKLDSVLSAPNSLRSILTSDLLRLVDYSQGHLRATEVLAMVLMDLQLYKDFYIATKTGGLLQNNESKINVTCNTRKKPKWKGKTKKEKTEPL